MLSRNLSSGISQNGTTVAGCTLLPRISVENRHPYRTFSHGWAFRPNGNNDYFASVSNGSGLPIWSWVDHGGALWDHEWTIADFNGDGRDDLLVANGNNDYFVSLWGANGFVSTTKWADFSGALRDHDWTVGDFNGDGAADLLVVNPSNDYAISLSTGDSFALSTTVDHGGSLFDHQWGLGDFDGNGTTDLLMVNRLNDYYVSLMFPTGVGPVPTV